MSEQECTVSWIVPVYNAEKTIEEAIQSIQAQTFSDFEILVINDGSTDKTLEIVQELAKSDSRIKIFTTPNRGVVHARSLALQNARGEWIACLDADDRARPERLRKQLNVVRSQKNALVGVGSDLQIIDEHGVPQFERHYPSGSGEVRRRMGWSNPIANPAVLFHRETALRAGGYEQNFEGAEDYLLWMRMLSFGDFCNLPETLTEYRIHSNQFKATRTLFQLKKTTEARLIGLPAELRGFSFHLRTFLERVLAHFPAGIVLKIFRLGLWMSAKRKTFSPGSHHA